MAAAVVRVEGHSRLISSRVDGCSPWVSGLSVYRFLELHRGIQLKCKIMPFHPLLLFIILKGQESSCSGFIPVELYYFRALLSALLFGEARCFLKNTKFWDQRRILQSFGTIYFLNLQGDSDFSLCSRLPDGPLTFHLTEEQGAWAKKWSFCPF